MSLRVLHVLDHSIPMQSGYAFRTCAILREQRRMGWETFHLTGPKHTAPSEPVEQVDGLVFYRTRWLPGRWGRTPIVREIALMAAIRRRLIEVVRLVKPDILHVHSPVLNALPAISIGRSLKIPVVYEVRAFWEDAAVDHGTSRDQGLRYAATRALETFALRRASHVTTICEGLRKDIVARGIAERKVTVIPNAVDIDAFEFGVTPDLALKSELGVADCIIVGFVGSFYAYEGLDLLLAALPMALQRVPTLRVLFVGGGPDEAALRAQAQRPRHRGQSHLHRARTPSRSASLLQHCRRLRVSSPFDAPHRACDPAKTARSDGAGSAVGRVRRGWPQGTDRGRRDWGLVSCRRCGFARRARSCDCSARPSAGLTCCARPGRL